MDWLKFWNKKYSLPENSSLEYIASKVFKIERDSIYLDCIINHITFFGFQ
jgi:hypothetical protein